MGMKTAGQQMELDKLMRSLGRPIKIEVGPGDAPEQGYDFYCDLHRTEYADIICHMEELPFDDGVASDLRAYEVLEHQSYTLLYPTLKEWYRVLCPGGRLHLKVPSARHYILAYVNGEIPMERLNILIMGGHTDKPVFCGYDAEKDVPRWLWNAHHALFDWQNLRSALQLVGFHIESYEDNTHITVEAVK